MSVYRIETFFICVISINRKTKIIDDDETIFDQNILIQFQFVTKFETFKMKKIIFNVIVTNVIKILKTLQLYEEQQKNNIEFIRDLKLHRKKTERKKCDNSKQITLNK